MPTRKFASYQLREALPYWFKRWVLFNKTATLRPLYQIEHESRPSAKADPERTSE